MSTPNERLAASLKVLERLQEGGGLVFKTKEIGRYDRERLLKNGFLQHVMRGWWISSSPEAVSPA